MISVGIEALASASIVSVEAVLARELGEIGDLGLPPPSLEWRPGRARALGDSAGLGEPVDRLLAGMAGAGHGVAALSFYLGLEEDEIRERAEALGLGSPVEKPLRRPSSANPWLVQDVRLLIALWLENVSAASIAETFGRTRASVHAKRRWLGLGARDRKLIVARGASECRRTALPWTPTFDVSAIVARLLTLGPSRLGKARFAPGVKWELGRDAEKDRRASVLGFAGLTAKAIAERMLVEFGVRLTPQGVSDRLTRLQVVRDRRDLIDVYDEETVAPRARDMMARLGATMRQCSGLNRSFWYCRAIGGNRWTCREFYRKKFAKRRAERNCGDVMAMAA